MKKIETTVRERLENNERLFLAPQATRAAESRGRDRPETPCPIRTDFQRDRDRIIHCNAFRRLKHKTQVFLSPDGDYYRTRLTHTLEVAQISRTVARALALNEDLTEAVALGHDLGHPPFGHAGESALRELMADGFAHNEQSVRMVERLENGRKGLNLTKEVRDGILCHTGEKHAYTLEGRIVAYCDRVAYINHDIDDAERAGVLREQDIPQELRDILGYTKSTRIGVAVTDLIQNNQELTDICPSPWIGDAMERLRTFMFERVYVNKLVKSQESKAKELLRLLFRYFMENAGEIPDEYQLIRQTEGLERAVCDHIASMSDNYAQKTFRNIYIPESWHMM